MSNEPLSICTLINQIEECTCTHPISSRETRNPGGEMNDVAAGVIDDTPVVEEAAAPEAVGADGVAEGEPERHKRHPRLNVHPPQNRARQQDRRDRRESELKVHQRRHREERLVHIPLHGPVGESVQALRHGGASGEVLLAEGRGAPAPEGEELVPEGDAVAEEDPADQDGGEGVERHEGGVDGPLLLHDAGVEYDETRHGLEADERRRRHLPRVVAFVEPFRHRREAFLICR